MPDLFFDASYLRYFGWVLSDPYALTRLEVTKQLRALYKNRDNIGGLATFTEKFRPRLVEMATRDADPAVRAATIELLDTMRASGLLEANDINAVGRLIFDAEERVRKTVASFFVDNVNDLYELKIEELGGMEALEGILAPDPVDALDGSQIAWLKLKALAEILSSYDAEDGGDSLSYLGRGSAGAGEMLVASGAESRFTLVTQVIFDKIPEIRNWESVAGYLLFDHSDANTNTATSDLQEGKLEAAINKICRLPAVEEAVLLEVLNAAVRLRLAQPQATEGKRQRTRKAGPPEDKETAALRLAQLIPKLLNKYGAEPATASAVLRLEHVLNLEVFQQLRQDSTTYAALLDDINKQFLTHNNQTVLVEASAALLHARNFEDLQEVTDEKMQELWEDVINVFNVLARDEDIGMQGSMSVRDLRDFSDNVQRISNLAAISDCVRPLEQTSSDEVNGDTNGHNATPPLQLLLQILGRGVPTSAPSASERDWLAVEEKLVNSTMATLLFYFMWKLRALQKAISDEPAAVAGITNQLKKSHDTFASQLVRIIENRSGADALRRSATGVFLDLYTLFATLRRVATGPSSDHGESADAVSRVRTLVSVVSDEHQLLVTYVYKATEMAYAKKSGRKIEIAEEDQLADDELESDDEDADVAENELQLARARQKLSFVYEKQLCELTGKIILAIAANVLDVSGAQKGKLRERLNMNRGRLGHNFKELIVYLDKSKGKKNKKPAARARTELKQPAPEPVIVDDGDPDDGQAGDNQAVEEGGEEDLRNRELELDVGDDHGDGEEHAVSDAGADDGGVLGD
ncbi:MAG: hypothetical protein M1826_004213 [Phylliscum demangeonii]|nr:MAG: hypothetical protein M1826_004213 [Phylliscum demangeonii]